MKTDREKIELIEEIYMAFDSEVLETHEQVIDLVRDVIENRPVTLPEYES